MDTHLSLLVIDLGDSVVVKAEKGDGSGIHTRSGGYGLNTGAKYLIDLPFTDIRDAIDALDSLLVPSVWDEQPLDLDRAFEELCRRVEDGRKIVDGGKNDYEYVFHMAETQVARIRKHQSLPIYEPSKGTWERLNTHDWTQAKKDAGEAGYGIDTFSYEQAICPVKIWRYVRTGSGK